MQQLQLPCAPGISVTLCCLLLMHALLSILPRQVPHSSSSSTAWLDLDPRQRRQLPLNPACGQALTALLLCSWTSWPAHR